jgi:hypothetical protein
VNAVGMQLALTSFLIQNILCCVFCNAVSPPPERGRFIRVG